MRFPTFTRGLQKYFLFPRNSILMFYVLFVSFPFSWLCCTFCGMLHHSDIAHLSLKWMVRDGVSRPVRESVRMFVVLSGQRQIWNRCAGSTNFSQISVFPILPLIQILPICFRNFLYKWLINIIYAMWYTHSFCKSFLHLSSFFTNVKLALAFQKQNENKTWFFIPCHDLMTSSSRSKCSIHRFVRSLVPFRRIAYILLSHDSVWFNLVFLSTR